MIKRHVFVTGLVQGVGFRAATYQEAKKHPNLLGFVRNLEDGRVEAVFAGEEKEVLMLVDWCRRGPPSAKVTKVEVKEEPYDSNLRQFEVRT